MREIGDGTVGAALRSLRLSMLRAGLFPVLCRHLEAGRLPLLRELQIGGGLSDVESEALAKAVEARRGLSLPPLVRVEGPTGSADFQRRIRACCPRDAVAHLQANDEAQARELVDYLQEVQSIPALQSLSSVLEWGGGGRRALRLHGPCGRAGAFACGTRDYPMDTGARPAGVTGRGYQGRARAQSCVSGHSVLRSLAQQAEFGGFCIVAAGVISVCHYEVTLILLGACGARARCGASCWGSRGGGRGLERVGGAENGGLRRLLSPPRGPKGIGTACAVSPHAEKLKGERPQAFGAAEHFHRGDAEGCPPQPGALGVVRK